jgi:Uncharacterised nucleotidyltransferase
MARTLCREDEYPRALLAVAGHGLHDTSRDLPADPLPAAEWAEVMTGARRHRLTGHLAAAIESGSLPATDVQRQDARNSHRSVQLRVLALEGELIAITELLAGDGVESRVLKGSAVAHLDYADPALRSYVDLDVLVHAADIAPTLATLGAAGFRRTLAEPRPGFDQRFDKGMTLRPAEGYELDLHRTFVLGPWGALMKPDQLWGEVEEFMIGGRTLRALSRTNRFLHACYHAALGDWPLRLGSLRDIAEMLRHAEDAAEEVRASAKVWHAEAVVAAAVADSTRLLGMGRRGKLATWAKEYVPTAREESWLALHNNRDKTFAAQALATLRVLPTWRDKLDYVRALAVPDRAYTVDRHASAVARFRYAIAPARLGSGARRPG